MKQVILSIKKVKGYSNGATREKFDVELEAEHKKWLASFCSLPDALIYVGDKRKVFESCGQRVEVRNVL